MNKDLLSKINRKVTVVLPEGEDERIIDSAKKTDFCNLIIIGKNIDINKDNVKVIDNETYEKLDELIEKYYELRKHKGMTLEEAKKELTENKILFACMLVREGFADGLVAGANHTSSDTIRPALQVIGAKNGFASAFTLVDTGKKELGENGLYLYSDTGLNQNPNSHELSLIAEESVESFKKITKSTPYLAFMSHSTKGSSKCPDQEKVVNAYNEFMEKNNDVKADGEMQFDAAIDKEIRKKKAPNSPLTENANIMVFPDLDAGNISYKITERLGGAKCYGPVLQGTNKPVSDLSRGSTVDDIIGTILIVTLLAQ